MKEMEVRKKPSLSIGKEKTGRTTHPSKRG